MDSGRVSEENRREEREVGSGKERRLSVRLSFCHSFFCPSASNCSDVDRRKGGVTVRLSLLLLSLFFSFCHRSEPTIQKLSEENLFSLFCYKGESQVNPSNLRTQRKEKRQYLLLLYSKWKKNRLIWQREKTMVVASSHPAATDAAIVSHTSTHKKNDRKERRRGNLRQEKEREEGGRRRRSFFAVSSPFPLSPPSLPASIPEKKDWGLEAG